jgi:hypothetical protein
MQNMYKCATKEAIYTNTPKDAFYISTTKKVVGTSTTKDIFHIRTPTTPLIQT